MVRARQVDTIEISKPARCVTVDPLAKVFCAKNDLSNTIFCPTNFDNNVQAVAGLPRVIIPASAITIPNAI